MLKPITTVVPREVVRTEYQPVPAALLVRRCQDIKLSEIATPAQLEEAFVSLWLCNSESNADKAAIEELK